MWRKKLQSQIYICSTTDHWIQESIKRIINSALGCFGQSGLQREKKNPNSHKYATFEVSFLCFHFLREVCLLFNFWMMKVPNGFFDIIVNFIIQKLKSKHTSLKKYTNWNKLSCLSLYIFLSFWGNERRQKTNIPHLWGLAWIWLAQSFIVYWPWSCKELKENCIWDKKICGENCHLVHNASIYPSLLSCNMK